MTNRACAYCSFQNHASRSHCSSIDNKKSLISKESLKTSLNESNEYFKVNFIQNGVEALNISERTIGFNLLIAV